MNDTTLIKPAILSDGTAELVSILNEMTANLNELQEAYKILFKPENWKGPAASATKEKFDQVVQLFEPIENKLKEYITFLTETLMEKGYNIAEKNINTKVSSSANAIAFDD